MRAIILGALCGAAFAATANAGDLYTPGPAASGGAYGPTWTGFYLGADVGGAWGNAVLKDTNGGVAPGPFPFSPSGVFGGGTAGYNLQAGHFVFGVETDVGYMDLSGSTTIGSAHAGSHQNVTLDGGAYGDLTGRIGYSLGQTLVYAKGGFAFYDGQGKQATTSPGYAPTGTGTFTGWTVGGGAEYFLSPAWSVKAEYLHFDFGHQGGYQTNVGDLSSPLGYRFANNFDLTADSVKAGINYHIGGLYEPLK